MRAASEKSVRHARGLLVPDELGENYLQVAEEFFGVSDVLAGNSSLVRALTSPSRHGDDKRALAERVFSSLQSITVRTVGELASSRWSEAADIIVASEDLGIEALMIGAKQNGELAQVEAQIFTIAEFLADNREVRSALAETRVATPQQRMQLAEQLFAERVHPVTMALLRHVVFTVAHGRIHSALMRVGRRASRTLATTMVIVEAARMPAPAQLERLRECLQRRYHTELTMNVRIVPELVGGLRIQIGADIIEGSLTTFMQNSRRILVGEHR